MKCLHWERPKGLCRFINVLELVMMKSIIEFSTCQQCHCIVTSICFVILLIVRFKVREISNLFTFRVGPSVCPSRAVATNGTSIVSVGEDGSIFESSSSKNTLISKLGQKSTMVLLTVGGNC